MRLLSDKSKDEIRKLIEERCEEVPSGKRALIPVDILESLIFNTYYFEKSKITLKIPVWTGLFLEKIDLSNVSFDDVFFGSYQDYLTREELTIEEKGRFREIMSINKDNKPICLKNTNARIDFSKSFGASFISTKGRCIQICNCDLSGVDLSDNTFEGLYIIINSDLSMSNLDFGMYSRLNVTDSNLEGVNLSKLKIGVDSISLDSGDNFGKRFKNVNLRNTKINFISEDENAYDILKPKIESGDIDGCYIDGVPVSKIKDEEQSIINKINEVFDKMDYAYEQYTLDLRNN